MCLPAAARACRPAGFPDMYCAREVLKPVGRPKARAEGIWSVSRYNVHTGSTP